MSILEQLRAANARLASLASPSGRLVEQLRRFKQDQEERERAELRATLRTFRERAQPRPQVVNVHLIVLPDRGPLEN